MEGEKGEADLTDGQISEGTITFSYAFQGSIEMVYTGSISGDKIEFSRDAGGFATEEAVATRVE